MKLTMLGTGNAMVTECYNTCFLIEDAGRYLMVDGGGGNTVLRQLKAAGCRPKDIHEIFVTHKHIDHLLGVIWMIRAICGSMGHGDYAGDACIYAHGEVIALLRDMAEKLLNRNEFCFLNDRLHLVEVHDGETRLINGRNMTFFDIHSTKARQFGFSMLLPSGEKLTCCGDEPYADCERPYAENSRWLLHEAFCLYAERDIYHPYEKHHSTVRDACGLAEKLHVKNLLLYHTEDRNIQHRKELYLAEGRQYYHGSLWVPDDLESIEL